MAAPTDAVATPTHEEEMDERNEEDMADNDGSKAKEEKRLRELIDRNLGFGTRVFCFNKNNKTTMQCQCLSILCNNEKYCEAVAEFQLMFENFDFADRKKIVIEWMRGNANEAIRKKYRIPFILHAEDNSSDYLLLRNTLICSNAMMDVLSKGYKWWKDCVDHNKNMTLPMHKLTGKMSNKRRSFLSNFEEDLIDHFEELKLEAEPIATRYVREVTGETTLRDKDDTALFLPSFFTQRNCYAKFCLEKCGMKISTTYTGTVLKTPVVTGEQRPSPSWAAYCTFWKDRYPTLKVRKPTEEICL